MPGSDLIKPLGLAKRQSRRPALFVGIAVAAALAAVGALGYRLATAPRGPTAIAVINAPAHKAEPAPSSAPPETATLTDITPVAGPPPAPSEDVVIHDLSAPNPDPAPEPAAPATTALAKPPAAPTGPVAFPNPELIEASSYGPLPRISASGERPLTAYARPAEVAPGAIRVAIVVGGLGIDRDSTASAVASLPGEITLAFAPYDPAMNADVAAARAAGHELLLQLPMEPFNYPAINPGQNTLTTTASEDENRARLRWLLGRMSGYVGVVNYLGARFTADQEAMTPLLREVASRGLLYLDDGSSPRSATEIAAGRAPFLRADVVLDADLSQDAIEAQLASLVSTAKARGFAVATATAFPLTVKEIAAFATTAANKGIALVPLTALLSGHS